MRLAHGLNGSRVCLSSGPPPPHFPKQRRSLDSQRDVDAPQPAFHSLSPQPSGPREPSVGNEPAVVNDAVVVAVARPEFAHAQTMRDVGRFPVNR
jgi:hypothetical protein